MLRNVSFLFSIGVDTAEIWSDAKLPYGSRDLAARIRLPELRVGARHNRQRDVQEEDLRRNYGLGNYTWSYQQVG